MALYLLEVCYMKFFNFTSFINIVMMYYLTLIVHKTIKKRNEVQK